MSDSFSQISSELITFIRDQDYSSASSSASDFDALALRLFRLQFDAVPVYRKLCEGRGVTPDSLTSWRQIPALPASAFKDFEITSLPEAERTQVFLSSGTTADSRSRHFHDADSLKVYEASLLPWFRAHLLPGQFEVPGNAGGLRWLVLTPHPDAAPNSSLAHMMGCVAPDGVTFTGGDSPDGWVVDVDAARKALDEACSSGKAMILLGTAFSFVHLLDALEESDATYQLPAGSRVMETGGYKGRSRELPKEELHRMISVRLGIPAGHIVCEYGMSELSSQAYDCMAGESESEYGVPALAGGDAPTQVNQSAQSSSPDEVNASTSLAPLGGEGRGEGASHELDGALVPQESPAIPTQPALPSTRHFRFPPWARVRIVSPETGQEVAVGGTGLIQIFDLANVRSVMALQTADLGIRREDGFELLGRSQSAEPKGCSLMAV